MKQKTKITVELELSQIELLEDLVTQELEAIDDMDPESKGWGLYETRLNNVADVLSKRPTVKKK